MRRANRRRRDRRLRLCALRQSPTRRRWFVFLLGKVEQPRRTVPPYIRNPIKPNSGRIVAGPCTNPNAIMTCNPTLSSWSTTTPGRGPSSHWPTFHKTVRLFLASLPPNAAIWNARTSSSAGSKKPVGMSGAGAARAPGTTEPQSDQRRAGKEHALCKRARCCPARG